MPPSPTWTLTIKQDGATVGDPASGIPTKPIVKFDADGRPVAVTYTDASNGEHYISLPSGHVIEVVLTPSA